MFAVSFSANADTAAAAVAAAAMLRYSGASSARIYREGNRTGFVKGFTDEPESLLAGFGRLEKVKRGGPSVG